MSEPPEKKLKTSSTEIFTVRWVAHGSTVDEWDNEALCEVETCGHTIEEAKSYIEEDGGGILSAPGLCRDNGVHPKAYSTVDLAKVGMKECYKDLVFKMRKAIMECADIDDQETYDALKEGDELVEYTNKKGKLPSTAQLLDDNHRLDMEIAWGQNSNATYQVGDLMPCCMCILTQVTVWIEKLELIVAEN